MMMDKLRKAKVSLRVDGDDLIPSEVSTLLRGEPRFGVRKGEVFVAANGKKFTAQTGKWSCGTDWESPPNIEDQISVILAGLNADLAAWQVLTERFHCYVSVGAYFNDWTGGITLMPGTMRLLAERGLFIDFDLYASEDLD